MKILFINGREKRESENDTKSEKEAPELMKVNASGPLKPRYKKKKLPNQNIVNTWVARPASSYFSKNNNSDKIKSSKKLAQALHEIPLDPVEFEYCPTCITVIMEYDDKRPSLYCTKCGLTIEVLDNTSSVVHDKENTTHVPFTYRPKLHFISWVKRITGKLRFSIPAWVIDEIHFRIGQRQIRDVNQVTWELVDEIIRSLAKNDKRYADYYPHVYQITNIIRGSPILTFDEEEEQEIFEYFDPIYMLWESKKHMFSIERSNFMYNALVLQIIFMILKYPPSVIKIFNMIKGDSNLKFYDNIIKMICKEFNEKPFATAEFEIMKYGKGKNIIDALKNMQPSEHTVTTNTNNVEKPSEESNICSVLLD